MAPFVQETFLANLQEHQRIFNGYLEKFCSHRPQSVPPRMWEAMVYSLRAGGKRIRPVLAMAGAALFGESPQRALPMALALEMVHTASLIHDDLPCMDDDCLRRGKPTNHVVFGEALALVAGDSLFLYAFEVALKGLQAQRVDPDRTMEAVSFFASALGPSGLCGGQVLDTDPQSRSGVEDLVFRIASMKTMALIRAAVVSGAIIGGALGADRLALEEYGRHVGIAFQIADDLLDQLGSQEEMGKTLGKDLQQDKATFIWGYGLEGASRLLQRHTDQAQKALEPYGERARFLRDLALYLQHRSQ